MTEENLESLTINYLTEEQYQTAKEAGNIDENQLYMTPDDSSSGGGSGISLLDVYPVGSIYMSVNNVNPSTLFGGEWESWGAGRVPVGVDTSQTEFNTVEKIGGEKTHKLTIDELARHGHSSAISGGDGGDYYTPWGFQTSQVPFYYVPTDFQGNDQPHNNLQPYITCYMWKRTA